jgi:recombination protein RecA
MAKPKKAAEKKSDADRYLEMFRQHSKDDETFHIFSDELAGSDITEFVSTGNLAIDGLIGGRIGGWPVGRMSELAAWEGVGKSTLLDQSMAEAQRMGGTALLIETEQSRDTRYMRKLGVDVDKLLRGRAETLERMFEVVDFAIDAHEKITAENAKAKKPEPLLFIAVDSLGALPAVAELDGDTDDKHVGVAARVNNMNFRRLAQRLGKCRIALVFSNHFYQGIGPFASLQTRGGGGIKYFTSLRVWMSRKQAIKNGSVSVGSEIEVKLKKTRVRAPRPPVTTAIIHGAGFDNAWALYHWGLKNGLGGDHRFIVKNGKWSYLMFGEGKDDYVAFEHSFVGLGEVFKERPDLYQIVAAKFLSMDDIEAGDVPTGEDED